MTDKEKTIVTAYTGVTMLQGEKLDLLYDYVSKLIGRPVQTFDFVYMADKIHELSKPDFLKLCAEDTDRPTGKWVENTRYKRKGKKFLDCSRCHYGENGDIVCEVSKLPNYCPNCGARMEAGK